VGIGTSIFLIALGAILTFAIEVDSASGFNINNIGVILMIVGFVGIVLSMAFWDSWGGFNRTGARRVVVLDDEPIERRTVVEREVPVRRRRIVTEEEAI
jgi:hypothetical protein